MTAGLVLAPDLSTPFSTCITSHRCIVSLIRVLCSLHSEVPKSCIYTANKQRVLSNFPSICGRESAHINKKGYVIAYQGLVFIRRMAPPTLLEAKAVDMSLRGKVAEGGWDC